MDSIFIWQE